MAAARKTTKSAFSSFLQSANSTSATPAPTAPEPDPTLQLLAALSEVPMTLSGLAERAGLPPKTLFETLGQLQSLRLVHQLEDDREGEVRFELLPGGRALLAKTARA